LFPIKLAKQAQHCLPPAGGLRRFDVIEVRLDLSAISHRL